MKQVPFIAWTLAILLLQGCSHDSSKSAEVPSAPQQAIHPLIAQSVARVYSSDAELKLVAMNELKAGFVELASLGCIQPAFSSKNYSLSPDKKHLVYLYCDVSQGYQLRILEPRTKTISAASDFQPNTLTLARDWSPDGRWLHATNDSAGLTHTMIDVTTGSRFVLNSNNYFYDGVFSGDGKYYFYLTFNQATSLKELWAFSADSGSSGKLFDSSDDIQLLGASRDGQYIAYNTDDNAQHQALVVYSTVSRSATEIQTNFAVNFSWLKSRNEAMYIDNNNRTLTQLNGETLQRNFLNDANNNIVLADFFQISPDESRLLFSSVLQTNNYYGIAALESGGIALKSLYANSLPIWGGDQARWSPDSRNVAIPIDSATRPHFQIIDRDGSAQTVGALPDIAGDFDAVVEILWPGNSHFIFLEEGNYLAREIFRATPQNISQITASFASPGLFPNRDSPIDLQADTQTSRIYYLRDELVVNGYPHIESVSTTSPAERLFIPAPADGALQYFDLL